MVHNKNSNDTERNKQDATVKVSHRFAGFAVFVLFIALLAGAGWYFYQNPELLKRESKTTAEDPKIVQLYQRIDALQNKLAVLEADNAGKISGRELAGLNERIDTHVRLNREILDSKAGNNMILGLINRLDMLEMRVNNLGKVSSNGALILTAAMLVKDSAESGKSFEYEASVLRQLAQGTNMEAAADEISQYASEGLPDEESLINEFNMIYEQARAQEQAQTKVEQPEVKEPQNDDWKDKINAKLSQLVSVKYHDKDGQIVETKLSEDEVYDLVNQGLFDQALIKMNNNPKYQSESYETWQKKVSAYDNFERAMNKIKALTLAVMKVENLKNVEQ